MGTAQGRLLSEMGLASGNNWQVFGKTDLSLSGPAVDVAFPGAECAILKVCKICKERRIFVIFELVIFHIEEAAAQRYGNT